MAPTSTVPMEVTYAPNGQTQTARFEVRRDGRDLLVSHGTAVENWQRAPQHLGDVQTVSFAPSKQHGLGFTQFLQGFMHQHAALTEERITLFRQCDANVLALAEMQSQLQAAVANAEYCHSMAQTQLAHEVELTQLRIANERSHIERDRAQLENSQYAVAQKEEEIKLTTANLEAKAQSLRQAEVEFQAAQERSARKDAEAQQQLAASAAALADGNKNQAAKAQALAGQQAQLNAWAAQLQNRGGSFKGYKARVEQEMQEVQRTRRPAQQVALQARTEAYARLEEAALQRRVLAKPAPPGANNPPLADAYVRGSRRRAGRTPSDSSSSYTSDGRSDSSSSSDDSIFSLPIRGRAMKHRPAGTGRGGLVYGTLGNKILRCEYVVPAFHDPTRAFHPQATFSLPVWGCGSEVARDKFEWLRLWANGWMDFAYSALTQKYDSGDVVGSVLHAVAAPNTRRKTAVAIAYPATGIAPEDAAPAPSAWPFQTKKKTTPGGSSDSTFLRKGYDRSLTHPTIGGSDPRAFFLPQTQVPTAVAVAPPANEAAHARWADSTWKSRTSVAQQFTRYCKQMSIPRNLTTAAAFLFSKNLKYSTRVQYAQWLRDMLSSPKDPFDCLIQGLRKLQAKEPKKQAPPLQRRELNSIKRALPDFSDKVVGHCGSHGLRRLLVSCRLDLDTMPCKGKRPRSASSRAPVSDKIGAGAPIVIDGCTDRWANVGLALRSVLPLDERCPLVMLGGDAPRSLEVARFLPNLLFCFRPAPVEWNNLDWAALPKSSDINPNRASRYCKITGKDAIRLQRVLAPLHPKDPLTSLTDSTLLKHLRQFGCSKHSIKRGAIQEATKIVRRNRHRFNDIHIISQLAKHKSATDISSVTVGYAAEFPADVAPINALMRRIATITRRAHHSRLATEEEVLNISLQQTDVTPLDLQAIKHRMNPTTLERFESLFATLSLPPTTFSTPGEQKRRLHASDAQLTTGAVNDATSAFRKAATVVGATVGEFMRQLSALNRGLITLQEYVVLPSSVWRQARVLNQLILTNTPYVGKTCEGERRKATARAELLSLSYYTLQK
eukprot:gene7048-4991_t